MKFLCTGIVDDDLAAAMTAEDRALIARGVFRAAEALMGRGTARTVRVRQRQARVTEGPFMESKRVLAGFILIDVPDADQAMSVAMGIPMARLGAVEVRPVMVF